VATPRRACTSITRPGYYQITFPDDVLIIELHCRRGCRSLADVLDKDDAMIAGQYISEVMSEDIEVRFRVIDHAESETAEWPPREFDLVGGVDRRDGWVVDAYQASPLSRAD
jgi:hypothetical protein